MANSIKRKDSTWYIAVIRMGGRYYPFVAAGGESYRDYAQSAKRHGIDVVAEQFGVSDSKVDSITGFDADGKRNNTAPLSELVNGFNLCPASDYSDLRLELKRLCSKS